MSPEIAQALRRSGTQTPRVSHYPALPLQVNNSRSSGYGFTSFPTLSTSITARMSQPRCLARNATVPWKRWSAYARPSPYLWAFVSTATAPSPPKVGHRMLAVPCHARAARPLPTVRFVTTDLKRLARPCNSHLDTSKDDVMKKPDGETKANVDRRAFLKASGFSLAAASTAAGCAPRSGNKRTALPRPARWPRTGPSRVVRLDL